MAARRSPMARGRRSSARQPGSLTPGDAAGVGLVGGGPRLLAPEMEALSQEQLRVVLLDTRNRVLDEVMIYQGSVHTAAVARMAELFRDAVIANAPNIVLVHNP